MTLKLELYVFTHIKNLTCTSSFGETNAWSNWRRFFLFSMSSMSTSSAGRSRSFIFSASSTLEFQQKSGWLSISDVSTLILVPWWLISLSSTCRLSYVILFWFEHVMSIKYAYWAHFGLKWNGVGIGPRHLWVFKWPYKCEGELLQRVWRD